MYCVSKRVRKRYTRYFYFPLPLENKIHRLSATGQPACKQSAGDLHSS